MLYNYFFITLGISVTKNRVVASGGSNRSRLARDVRKEFVIYETLLEVYLICIIHEVNVVIFIRCCIYNTNIEALAVAHISENGQCNHISLKLSICIRLVSHYLLKLGFLIVVCKRPCTPGYSFRVFFLSIYCAYSLCLHYTDCGKNITKTKQHFATWISCR